jgi:large subunit ribosomal protein L25
MADILSLSAQLRDRVGKGAARAVRRAGLIPAVIYGGKETPIPVSLEPGPVNKQIATGEFFTTMVEMKVGNDTHRVLARDVQYHPVSDRPEHIDFLRVTAATRITVEVPVVFENEEESPGIKRGGVLNIVRHQVEMECRADAIPHALTVDLTPFDVGDSIHISHVPLPDGVTPTITDRDFTIATVAAPTVVRDEALEAEAEAEAAEGGEGEGGEEAGGEDEEKKDGD